MEEDTRLIKMPLTPKEMTTTYKEIIKENSKPGPQLQLGKNGKVERVPEIHQINEKPDSQSLEVITTTLLF